MAALRRSEGLGEGRLREIMTKWQGILGFSDWDLKLEMVDFRRERQSGDIKIDEPNQQALVLMAREPFREDEELTLVHELVHLRLWKLDQMIEELIGLAFGDEASAGGATGGPVNGLPDGEPEGMAAFTGDEAAPPVPTFRRSYAFAYNRFMEDLEFTTHALAKALLRAAGKEPRPSWQTLEDDSRDRVVRS